LANEIRGVLGIWRRDEDAPEERLLYWKTWVRSLTEIKRSVTRRKLKGGGGLRETR
jgi:hypothetical protein